MSGLRHSLLSNFCSTKLTYLGDQTKYHKCEYVFAISNSVAAPYEEFQKFIALHFVNPNDKSCIWTPLDWDRNSNSKPPSFKPLKSANTKVLSYMVEESGGREYGPRSCIVQIKEISSFKFHGEYAETHAHERGILIRFPDNMIFRVNASGHIESNPNGTKCRDRYKTDKSRQTPMNWTDEMKDMFLKVPSMQQLKGLQCYSDYFMGWMERAQDMESDLKEAQNDEDYKTNVKIKSGPLRRSVRGKKEKKIK
eukprot:596757_1